MQKADNLKAIWWVLLGLLLFSVGDVLAKFVTTSYPPVQLLYMISLISVSGLVIYGVFKNGNKAFKTPYLKIHLFRGFCATVIGILELIALRTIQLDVFYTVVFTVPFWIVILEFVILKDKIGWHRGAVLFFGFIVLLFMIRPDGALFSFGALLVLIAMVAYGVSMISLRFIGKDDNPIWLPLAGPLCSLILLFPWLFLVEAFVVPTLPHIFICMCISAVFVFGAYYVSIGYYRASTASVVAPYQYVQIIWGVVFGYLIFGDIPSIEVVIGAGLLIISGIYLIRFEKKN